MPGFFAEVPSETNAYHCDGTHEYFGFAAKGTLTTHSHWQIFKIEYNTSYATAGDPWIIKWPNGSDQPIFKWVDVATLSYRILGC